MLRRILIGLLITVIVAPIASQEMKQEPSPAPQFTLKDLNGKTVRLSGYKGKVVLLNFWATWCAPCRAEMPDLVKLQREYETRGLQVVGVTYPDYSRRAVQKIARQLKVNYPIVFSSRELAAKYNVGEVLPATIIIDQEGKIRGRILGIMQPEEFEQSVKPLL
jgi:peroxiredoxin